MAKPKDLRSAVQVELPQVEKAIEELEKKLQEVQSIHNIVEFDADALTARRVTREKRDPRLQLASGGAAQLAEQVAEELKDWKKKRENAYAQRRHVREKLHRDAVQGKRQEEQDKQKVRDFVREVLFDVAKHALSSGTAKGIPPVSARTSSGLETEDPHGSISAGAPALLLLRSRLGSLVERLEATDAPPPAEMVQAAALAKEALNRKRERMKAASLKHRFAELTHGADQELLDEAELGFEQRHSVLQNLSDHLRQVVNSLRASVDHRQQAFSELDAANRGPASQAPKAWWKALNDDQDTETELESVRPCLAEGDEPSEELRSQLQKQVLDWGHARIAELCQSFQRRYSQADASHEAWMAESQLEAWKLRARLELLQELRREAQAWHQKKLTSLQLLQEHGGGKGQTESGAAAIAEVFLTLQTGINKSLLGITSAEVADYSLSRLEHVSSWHSSQLQLGQLESSQGEADSLAEAARAQCGLQLADALQQLVQQCHQALPLSAAEVNPEALRLGERCENADVPVAERFKSIGACLSGLPATPDTCALQQSLLTVIDSELQRLCALFRSRDLSQVVAADEYMQEDEIPFEAA